MYGCERVTRFTWHDAMGRPGFWPASVARVVCVVVCVCASHVWWVRVLGCAWCVVCVVCFACGIPAISVVCVCVLCVVCCFVSVVCVCVACVYVVCESEVLLCVCVHGCLRFTPLRVRVCFDLVWCVCGGCACDVCGVYGWWSVCAMYGLLCVYFRFVCVRVWVCVLCAVWCV